VLAAAAAVATSLAMVLPAGARATTYTVTSSADGAPLTSNCTVPVGNSCRLRDAIEAANVGSTDDIVNIQSGLLVFLSQTGHDDTNAAGDLDIQAGPGTGSLEIVGLGPDAGIDSPSLDRVLDNIGGNSSPVTFSNLEVGNGNPQTAAGNDGGVFRWRGAAGDLIIENSSFAVSRATAGGVVSVNSTAGSTTVTDSFFDTTGAGSTGGGAISTNRPLSIEDSRFEEVGTNGGPTLRGGALLLDGANADATVNRSSFVEGSANLGSAFSLINGASLAVSNSTVGENNATLNFGGGAVSVEGAASTTSFDNVTFADNRTDSTNGATFALDGTAVPANQEVANSIVQTMDPQNANCTVGGATQPAFASLGHNIQFGGGSPDTPCAISPGPGDLTANPLLPGTFSFFAASDQNGYVPLAGSPAIDGGLNCDALSGATDQLGAARTQGTACDVGAIEQAPAPPGSGSPGATFTLGKPKSKRNGSVKLPVTTTGAGSLLASDPPVKKSKKGGVFVNPTAASIGAAGAVTLTLRPNGIARKRLAAGGRVKTTVEVTFTPTGGKIQSKTVKVKLKTG
jgi:hypothetical protein